MTLPKTVLVPTDFSESSNHALAYAVELAKALGAEVLVMHAYEVPVAGFPDGQIIVTPEMITRIEDSAQIGLKHCVALAGTGVPVRTMLKQGSIWRTIVQTTKDIEAGMVVMGTHGRQGISRALLGSVAEKVVRMAGCPVLTVQAPGGEAAAKQ